MTVGMRRRCADLAGRVLQATLPPALQSWGEAVRHETASIPDDTKALLFALGSCRGLLLYALASRLSCPVAGDPRKLGVSCATGAVALGLTYMALAGAPLRYLVINGGAWLVGLAVLVLVGRVLPALRGWSGALIVAMSGALLATGMLGASVEGAARWVRVGPLSLQPSLILLPAMLVAFERRRSRLAAAGLITAAVALALQPDRAMAGMLTVALAVLLVMRPGRAVAAAFAASIIAFGATLARADTLPAAAFVDRILYSSFELGAGAGLAVTGGSALLLVPAIVGLVRDPANRATYAVFGSVWLAAIAAAALGNYPTPIVGYGGSAIVGYALSLLALPRSASPRAGAVSPDRPEPDSAPLDRHPLVALA